MTHEYIPLIEAPATDGGFSNVNVITLQEQLHEHDPAITHIRTKQGKVWKIFTLLNKKSVPLNHAGDGPQRVNFTSVGSFGVLGDPENTATAADTGDTPDETPSPQVTNADGNPINANGQTFGEHLQNPGREVGSWTPDTQDSNPQETLDSSTPAAHAGRAHALLSASGAHRWLNCTPSARLEEHLPDTTSAAAEEGTAAHELAEHKLLTLLGNAFAGPHPESDWNDEEMESHTDDYADHVMAELARTRETSPGAFLAVEERLDFSHIVEDGFGTGDATIIGDGTMTIVDLKYGKGVEVSAENNPQLKLYALGALRTYGMIYNIQQVRLVIFQPRRNNISVWETTVEDLLEWAEMVVKPAAALAHEGAGELRAGEWCQFCRHAPQCTALAAQHFEVIPTQSPLSATPAAPNPETLTDAQIAQIVRHAGQIKKWLTAVEKHAQDRANAGHHYPGLKLVEGRSVRRYTDEQAVAQAVEQAGHDPYEKRLLGITAMTKLLGKKDFDTLLGDFLHKPEGAPTLVPEDDKRPALTVATPGNVFEPIKETT